MVKCNNLKDVFAVLSKVLQRNNNGKKPKEDNYMVQCQEINKIITNFHYNNNNYGH